MHKPCQYELSVIILLMKNLLQQVGKFSNAALLVGGWVPIMIRFPSKQDLLTKHPVYELFH